MGSLAYCGAVDVAPAASPSSCVNTVTGEGLAQARVRSQPPRPGSRRGRPTSCGVVGRRHRPPAREWLLPGEDGPGKTHQSFLDPLHDRACYAVLRVRGRDRPIGDGRLPPVLMQPIVSDDVAAVMA